MFDSPELTYVDYKMRELERARVIGGLRCKWSKAVTNSLFQRPPYLSSTPLVTGSRPTTAATASLNFTPLDLRNRTVSPSAVAERGGAKVRGSCRHFQPDESPGGYLGPGGHPVRSKEYDLP